MPEIIRNKEWENIDLDYVGENNFASFFSSDGNIHTYPAKAVPEMVNSLLTKLKELYDVKTVLDPFVGSGTIAHESKYLGLKFYGSDLNPLAVLLTKTRILTIQNTPYLKKRILEFANDLISVYPNEKLVSIEEFDNIEYWFKEKNIRELSYLKHKIDLFIKSSRKCRKEVALIMLTAFSSTIRSSSLSRNGEFKLYRMSTNDIENFSIDSIVEFRDKVVDLLNMLVSVNKSYKNETESEIYLENAKNLVFLNNKQIDLIMTSPPYGDSQSTVSYGQFSRLSLQWMGDLLEKYLDIEVGSENCDKYLLGGKDSEIVIKNIEDFNSSNTLKELIENIDRIISRDIEACVEAKEYLLNIIGKYNKGKLVEISVLQKNGIIYELLRERIRLDIYRKINNKKTKLTSREIKELARMNRDKFFNDLADKNNKNIYKRTEQIKARLPFIIETLDRKIKGQPKRKKEVIKFFKDLYQVFIESDRVLSDGGIQAWIVGHRTVFGEIVVNMEGVLRDWFLNRGYTLITSLQRKYSFKRMPHHINSTISRNDQVQTMMHEYILIVQKTKNK